MRLMPNKSAPCLEDEMQLSVAEYFAKRKFPPSNWNGHHSSMITPKIYREVSIPKIGRISDVVVFITERKVVNIECKLKDYDGVTRQALDHLKWADYSYVCLYSENYLPTYIIKQMMEAGIGLLLWNKDTMVEVLQASWSRVKDKQVREVVMEKLKKMDRDKQGALENKRQLTVDMI